MPVTASTAAARQDKKRKRKERTDDAAAAPKAAKTPSDAAAAFYRTHDITVHGEAPEARFAPCMAFDDAAFPRNLRIFFERFERPTPIQAACWAPLLAGRDVVGIAETGSGKTLAFGLPAMVRAQKVLKKKTLGRGQPVVLVLAPTRELALQTHVVVAQHPDLHAACVYGGIPKHTQAASLAAARFLVATPGRLIDFLDDGAVDLSQVRYLVLDEADRMLDCGFERDVRKILTACSSRKRQTVMFSATWPAAIRKLASEFMAAEDPESGHGRIRIAVGNVDQLTANTRVTQHVHVLADPRDKEHELLKLIKRVHASRKNRVLVFALYKKEAVRLESMLTAKGWSVGAIHGDRSQREREQALEAFRSGTCPLLVATDVAARGLDIPNVECVINVTFPLTIEDYVHRIGRTGRGGQSGEAYTFFTVHDKAHAGALGNVLRQAGVEVPADLLKFGGTVKKKANKNYGAFYREVDPSVKGTKIVFD